ncbi:MAG: hypothetical protein AB7I08_07815 [Thermoleophilia bacterium]
MEDRLVPLNALLALTLGHGGWPPLLGDAGFRLHLIEAPVQTSLGPVVVDVILVREEPPCVLLCEAKSGANISNPQAQRYAQADWRSLERAGSEPPALRGVPDVPVGALFATLEVHRDRVALGLTKLKLDIPILSITPGGAVTVVGAGAVGIPDTFDLPVPGLPPAIVPADEHSQVEVLLDPVRAQLVAAMARREHALDLEVLCGGVFPQWQAFGRGARSTLRKKVWAACRALERAELKGRVRSEQGGGLDKRVAILKSPETFDPRGRTQGYQRLQREAAGAGGRVPKPPMKDQLSLDDMAESGGLGDE